MSERKSPMHPRLGRNCERDDQIEIHNRISRRPDTAESYLSKVFPSQLCNHSKMKCCTKCGFSSSDTSHLKNHYGKRNKHGCVQEFHSTQEKEIVITNKTTGLQMPQKMIQKIIEGNFSLPYITRPPSYSYPQYAPPLRVRVRVIGGGPK